MNATCALSPAQTDRDPAYTTYQQACEQCSPDLYRMALLALGQRQAARAAVLETCAQGARCLRRTASVREVKLALSGLLYRYCRERMFQPNAEQSELPELFLSLSRRQRLIIALRFGSGLNGEEACRAAGLSKDKFARCLSQAMHAAGPQSSAL